MATPKKIEMHVDCHSSGRLTLKERAPSETMWNDITEEKLFGNNDAVSFYRAVSKRMADYAAKGVVVASYVDRSE